MLTADLRVIIQHSIDFASASSEPNADAVSSRIESRILLEKSVICANYRMTDANCGFFIKRTADGSNTKFILSAWPYILSIEIRKDCKAIHISLCNEVEGVSNYELCQHLAQICREIVGDVR